MRCPSRIGLVAYRKRGAMWKPPTLCFASEQVADRTGVCKENMYMDALVEWQSQCVVPLALNDDREGGGGTRKTNSSIHSLSQMPGHSEGTVARPPLV